MKRIARLTDSKRNSIPFNTARLNKQRPSKLKNYLKLSIRSQKKILSLKQNLRRAILIPNFIRKLIRNKKRISIMKFIIKSISSISLSIKRIKIILSKTT